MLSCPSSTWKSELESNTPHSLPSPGFSRNTSTPGDIGLQLTVQPAERVMVSGCPSEGPSKATGPEGGSQKENCQLSHPSAFPVKGS